MIIVKDVPGLTTRETLEALTDIVDPDDPPIATGYGGFVVDEDVAERFLSAYLIVAGKRPTPVATAVNNEPTELGPARATVRRAGKRKEVL